MTPNISDKAKVIKNKPKNKEFINQKSMIVKGLILLVKQANNYIQNINK